MLSFRSRYFLKFMQIFVALARQHYCFKKQEKWRITGFWEQWFAFKKIEITFMIMVVIKYFLNTKKHYNFIFNAVTTWLFWQLPEYIHPQSWCILDNVIDWTQMLTITALYMKILSSKLNILSDRGDNRYMKIILVYIWRVIINI